MQKKVKTAHTRPATSLLAPTHYVCMVSAQQSVRAFCVVFLLAFCSVAPLPAFAASYTVEIKSDNADKAFLDSIDDWQETLEERKTAFADEPSLLVHRFEQDQLFLQQQMKAHGFYHAVIDSSFDENTQKASFSIQTGPRYHFEGVTILLDSLDKDAPPPAIDLPEINLLKARTGQPAIAQNVLDDETFLRNWVEAEQCLFDYSVGHEAALDHITRQVDIQYNIAAGKQAVFGTIELVGHTSIAEDYLRRAIKIKQGDCFKRSVVNETRLSLQKGGLLSKVDAEIAPQPDATGAVPVRFTVTEGKHRTLKAGANYGTDIGAGISFGWEHRNLLKRHEVFSTSLTLAQQEQSLQALFEKPHFLHDDQKLRLSSRLAREDYDAYESIGFDVTAGIVRDLKNDWQVGLETAYGFEQIKDNEGTRNVALLSLPVYAAQDKRDDLLHPTRGWTVHLGAEPAIDTLDTGTSFVKNRATGTYYHRLTKENAAVETLVASRLSVGSIWGASRADVPPTGRLYTGGAGSVRGYGFQKVGPVNAGLDPIGGLSSLEMSAELRFRVKRDYGFVAFIDGGNVFTSSWPDFDDGLQWGAGVGFRYFTGFGPLRIDIGFPINRRRNIDDSFQIYFSIGQAF